MADAMLLGRLRTAVGLPSREAGERPSSAAPPGLSPAWLVALAGAAFLVRWLNVAAKAGLGFFGRYDDGVYYTAADALIHGRLPYRDFLLLHPPGIVLLLAPFAELGRLTTDATGMGAARVGFMLLGALNTVLVALLAGRWGRASGLAAGALYAVWQPAVYAEQSTMLETLGATCVLAALLLLVRPDRLPTPRAHLWAGVWIGAAMSVKIWYAAPWLVLLIWQLAGGRVRAAARFLLGSAAAVLVIAGPFFVLAPAQMFRLVISDQLARADVRSVAAIDRLASVLGVHQLSPSLAPAEQAIAVVAALVLVAAAATCLRYRAARILVVLLAVEIVVLFYSPPYFEHYSEFTAGPAAAVVGIAAGRVVAGGRRVARGALVAAVAAVMVASVVVVIRTPLGRTVDAAALARVAPPGCLASDDPQLLIQVDRLSSDLALGCRVPVDVSGITHAGLRRVGRNGRELPRPHNPAWQRWLRQYLTSASGFFEARLHLDGMSPLTARRLAGYPLLGESDNVPLRSGRGGGGVGQARP